MRSLHNDLEKAEGKIVRLRTALEGMLMEWDQLTYIMEQQRLRMECVVNAVKDATDG